MQEKITGIVKDERVQGLAGSRCPRDLGLMLDQDLGQKGRLQRVNGCRGLSRNLNGHVASEIFGCKGMVVG